MKNKIKPAREEGEAEDFDKVRKEFGLSLLKAMGNKGITLSELSRRVYGNDKQTTLIRRTIEGEVDAQLVTLVRYARALDCDLNISITKE